METEKAKAPWHATDIFAEQQQWRARVLTGVGWTGAGALATGVGMALLSRDVTLAMFLAASAVLALLTVVLRRWVGFRVRAWLLVGPFFVASVVLLALEGFLPNDSLAFGAAVIFATLLLGRRSGVALLGLAAIAMVGVPALQHVRSLVVARGYEPYAEFHPIIVARFAFNFVVTMAVVVGAISYLLSRGEALLVAKAAALEEKEAALEKLRYEQHEADRMRDELARQEDAMRKAREIEVLGRLAGSVAHDFNNALVIIGANTDLIRRRPAYMEMGLSEIDAAVLQAASTTRQLRGLSPQVAAPPRAIDLGDTVRRTGTLLQRVLPTNIDVQVGANDAPVVLADEGQLQGIVTNLALNARDAMPQGGKLELRAREATDAEVNAVDLRGRHALLEVVDNGVGMSQETQGRMFEPYFTTKGAAGTGLGLASVKAQVETSGGRILVTSALGRGTRFRLLWALYEPTKTAARESTDGVTVRGGTVLLVEDDEHVRAAMVRALGWRGFTVLEAPNGDEALTVARRYRGAIDVLCSDCVMPGIPVRQMVERFRGLFPAGRVVLCSAYAPEDVAPPREMIDAFVAKPFTLDALASTVGALVGKAEVEVPRVDLSWR